MIKSCISPYNSNYFHITPYLKVWTFPTTRATSLLLIGLLTCASGQKCHEGVNLLKIVFKLPPSPPATNLNAVTKTSKVPLPAAAFKMPKNDKLCDLDK